MCSLRAQQGDKKRNKQIRRLRSLVNYIVLFVSHLNRTAKAVAAASVAVVNVMAEAKNKNECGLWTLFSVLAQSSVQYLRASSPVHWIHRTEDKMWCAKMTRLHNYGGDMGTEKGIFFSRLHLLVAFVVPTIHKESVFVFYSTTTS